MADEVKQLTTHEKMDVLNDELHVLRRLFEHPPGAVTPELLDVMRLSVQYIHSRYQTLAHDVLSSGSRPNDLQARLNAVMQFLASACGKGRIVSSGELTSFEIAEAQANMRFYVDPATNLGWAMMPWELTTPKDKDREGNKRGE